MSLNLISGKDGILEKAKTTADTTKEEIAKEQVTLKIAEYQNAFYSAVYVDHSEGVNTKQGEWIAKNYGGKEIETQDYKFTIEKAAPYTVTIKQNNTLKAEIKGTLSKDGKLTWASSGGGATYTPYSVGDEVELKSDSNEHFYVIKASGEDEEKVTLLAKKNIDTTTLAQSDSAGTVAFSSTNYWSSISGITYPYDLNNTATSAERDAIAKAKAYGTSKGGTGRLMTVGEVVALGGDMDNYDSSACPSWINSSNYWLGSAYSAYFVWDVNGERGYLNYGNYGSGRYFGVRPVIEISKSLIQQ